MLVEMCIIGRDVGNGPKQTPYGKGRRTAPVTMLTGVFGIVYAHSAYGDVVEVEVLPKNDHRLGPNANNYSIR